MNRSARSPLRMLHGGFKRGHGWVQLWGRNHRTMKDTIAMMHQIWTMTLIPIRNWRKMMIKLTGCMHHMGYVMDDLTRISRYIRK
jgi:hypothetical protein